MKRLLLGLLLLVLAPLTQATTAVNGVLQNLGTGTVSGGAFVRFWLRGCGGNQPRVSGTALIAPSQGGVFFFDFIASNTGVITGTLYSTRDNAGTGNGEIECGGSKVSVWYGMQIFVGGKGGPEIPIHARNGVTLDITTVTPLSVTPPASAPSGDATYIRLDGTNGPVSGVQNFQGGISGVKGSTTAGQGVPVIVAVFDATAQQANIGSTLIFAVPGGKGGVYRLNAYIEITQAASVSSALPTVQVTYTAIDSSVTQSNITLSNTSGANTLGTFSTALAPLIEAKSGTNISLSTGSYASSGATPMQYAIHVRLEYLG